MLLEFWTRIGLTKGNLKYYAVHTNGMTNYATISWKLKIPVDKNHETNIHKYKGNI